MSHFNFCVNQRTATTNWPDAEEGALFTVHHQHPVVQTPLTQHLFWPRLTYTWVTGQWGSPPFPETEASWTSPHRSWNEKVGSLWWQEAWSKRQSQTVSLPLPQFLFHLLQAPIVVRPRKGKDTEDYLCGSGKRELTESLHSSSSLPAMFLGFSVAAYLCQEVHEIVPETAS